MAAVQPVAASSVSLLVNEIVRHAMRECRDKDTAFARIEQIGYHVGRNLVEM